MANRARHTQERTIRKKSPNMKRKIQRAFSWSVVSNHLSVKVYDSHANTFSSNVRGNAQREKLERKKYSLQEKSVRYEDSSNRILPTSEWNNGDGNGMSNTVMRKANVNHILSAECSSPPRISSLFSYEINGNGLGPSTAHMQNTMKSSVKERGSNGTISDIYRVESPSDSMLCRAFCHWNGRESTSPLTTGRWTATRQNRQKYNVLNPGAERKPDCILDTVNMYKKHSKEAKHNEKLINDIQLQAKLRPSSKTNSINFHDLKCGLQRPRRLSPLREKPRLPDAIEATKDKRFQQLLQSLAKVHTNQKMC